MRLFHLNTGAGAIQLLFLSHPNQTLVFELDCTQSSSFSICGVNAGKQKTMWLAGLFHDPGGGVIQTKKPVVHFAHSRVFCLLQTSCEHGIVSNKKARHCRAQAFSFVGVAGFEPATLWSQTRCANRAALHPAVSSEA
jgi:hypothetical protein